MIARLAVVVVLVTACGRIGFDRAGPPEDGAGSNPPADAMVLSLGTPCTTPADCGGDAPLCECGTCQVRPRTCCTSPVGCQDFRCGCGACAPTKGECCTSAIDCATNRCGAGRCDPGYGDPCTTSIDCATNRCGAGRCDPRPGDPCTSAIDCESFMCVDNTCL